MIEIEPAESDKGDGESNRPSFAEGVDVIRRHLKTLPNSPGVYRMIAASGDVLYVGKAKNLRKRVVAYTQPLRLDNRLMRMVSDTRSMEFITTHTEAEALLLESNLIKKLRPRYNIVLRDDKSFPYIVITGDHDYPQIKKHRGARSVSGEFFGPFANAGAVNRTINALQRAFLLRSCSDNVFANRSRPCLLYQIKRCSGPCVDRISSADYGALVAEARTFLTGASKKIQEGLAGKMQEASDQLDFENAAKFRDRIRGMAMIQSHQDINPSDVESADVIAAFQIAGQTCIQVFFIRAGRNNGNRAYFPANAKSYETADVISAFIAQFYDNKPPPPLVLVSDMPTDSDLLAEALSVKAERKVRLHRPERGSKRELVAHALSNAREALERRLAESASQRRLLDGVAEVFDMDGPPDRIEVYDNSHISGTEAFGAMIVAGPEGFIKKAYRKFRIREAAAGDDYGMMREVFTRRFSRALKEDPDRQKGDWPDLVLIDGGQGQLNAVVEVMADLGIDDVAVASIAKGPDRNAGRERFFLPGREPFSLEMRDPVLYFLQRLRDESHRFVIGSHRTGRSKQIQKSALDEVPGIGAKRKKALLHHFGSARGVSHAGLRDLESVDGISRSTAKKIYDHFHPEG
ncbi:MAG: excinuclease ABC subunit UvrC [Rhodospirillales bacterium]